MILPFPGGIARSGSKVGSKYKGLRASTNTAFAPTLRGVVPTEMPPEARCAYEIVIDGLTLEAVERATAAGLRTAADRHRASSPSPRGTTAASSGRIHIRLHDVLERYAMSPSECLETGRRIPTRERSKGGRMTMT